MPAETNERGLDPRSASQPPVSGDAFRGAHEVRPETLTPNEIGEVNKHQDELMAVQSVDGRSPTSRQRSLGWQMLAIGFGLLVGLIIVVAMIYGVPGATAVRYAVVLLALLSIGGMPIWVLVNWRGIEERAAHQQAAHEHEGQSPTR